MTDYADPADDPTCQRLRLGAYIITEVMRRRGASDAEIEREIADLAREMERSGST